VNSSDTCAASSDSSAEPIAGTAVEPLELVEADHDVVPEPAECLELGVEDVRRVRPAAARRSLDRRTDDLEVDP
jgi:hypothetical protein